VIINAFCFPKGFALVSSSLALHVSDLIVFASSRTSPFFLDRTTAFYNVPQRRGKWKRGAFHGSDFRFSSFFSNSPP
jgi:hypothetical protein